VNVGAIIPATTRTLRWASPKQRQQFEHGPTPVLASGGWGAAKTTGFVLKAIYLSTEFPKNRGVIARYIGKELRATTMSTFYKWCPPRLYDKRGGGRRNDQNGYLKFAESGSEILFLNLDDPETQGIIRGLEMNWFLIDQAEENPEHMEENFDLMLGRLGRWDIAEVPQRHVEAYRRATGDDWPYKHPDSGRNVPPPYALLTCNPDIETHWLYRRFHPESEEWQTIYKALGYTFIDMPSLENQFLGDINTKFLLSRDSAFVRRNVDGVWGMPEGAIHVVDKLSIIPGSESLVRHLVGTCLLYRTADHGDSAPTAVGWWAVDREGNVFCVAPETRVLTAALKWVAADSVTPGTLLAGFDEYPSASGRRRWRESFATAVARHEQPCYRLTFSDGTTVMCSANHRWLTQTAASTNSNWRSTESLKIGQSVVKAVDRWREDETWGAGYLAAAFDSEGSYGYSNHGTPRVNFTQKPNAVLQRVVYELAQRGIAGSVYPGDRTFQVVLDRKRDVLQLLGQCRPGRLLQKFNLDAFGGFRGATLPTLVTKEFLGVRPVIAIETTTGTYIAEGLASHNCYREYYQSNKTISVHRANIFELSKLGGSSDTLERYEQNLMDPSAFTKLPTKQGGRWAVTDEYCLAPHTKILTADLRHVPVGGLEVGDAVAGFDEGYAGTRYRERPPVGGATRKWRTAVVEAVVEVIRPSYRLVFADGTEVICSEEHRWLSNPTGAWRLWRTTGHLQVGHGVCRATEVWQDDRSWSAGYLAAAFDGEGFLTQVKGTNRIGFSQRDNAMLTRVTGLLDDRGFRYSRSTTRGTNGDVAQLTLTGPRMLRLLGSMRPARLLPRFDVSHLGEIQAMSRAILVRKEFLGKQRLVGLRTSTRTCIAEGLMSHNSDVSEYPRETAIFWHRADNNELGTRNRINEYLAVDPNRVHPIYKTLGSPRMFFVTANEAWPQGVLYALKQTRSARRVKVGTELGKPIFSDERDDGVDHAYDFVRYFLASRPAVPKAPGQLQDGTFLGARARLEALNRRRMGMR